METHTSMTSTANVARVVLVGDGGQVLLDTLVKPQIENVALKAGIKTQLFKLSKEKGPTLELIRDFILQLVAGKKVIGYQLPQKMTTLGFFDSRLTKKSWTDCFDIANAFDVGNSSQHMSFPVMCEKYLNLVHKKRPSPCFAVSNTNALILL